MMQNSANFLILTEIGENFFGATRFLIWSSQVRKRTPLISREMGSFVFDESKIVGVSRPMREMLKFIQKVAKSDKPVLLLGETGTGKDLAARKVHELSDRRHEPFVAINCANFPSELFEAELFGYAKGAFTGAYREKQGLLEVARRGTVFLDEIGELSFPLQAKILRLIEEKEMRRIGETITREVFARFIFATNKDLRDEVRNGRFRKDLYFRISVVKFRIPPLRERKEDIPLLIAHFLERENIKNKTTKRIASGAIEKLLNYHFPGNIRELENIIERACVFSEGEEITAGDIHLDDDLTLYEKNSEITPDKLRETLESCRWNKTRAAHQIGKSRRQFYRLLEKYRMFDCIKRHFFV